MEREEELEDEITELDIKEDLCQEDSDATPTNTPVNSAPPKFVLLPYSSNMSGFFYSDSSKQYSSDHDCDMRSDSSLSWGEDEFEGEATRTVNALFNQLDQLMYNPDPFLCSVKFPALKALKKLKEKSGCKVVDPIPYPLENSPCYDGFEDEESCLSLPTSLKSVSISPPSKSLIDEIHEWISNFPHLRISGLGIDITQYEKIESKLLTDINIKRSSKNSIEEVVVADGEYENKLHFLSLKPEIDKERKEKHARGPLSQICSGSMDHDLLKEHTLIRLFDRIWPIISKAIKPLLDDYAHFLINQSVHYSSISPGSSANGGGRALPRIPTYNSITKALPTSMGALTLSGKCSNLTNLRSSSAIYRLPDKVPSQEGECNDDLDVVLQISCKPLLFVGERANSASRLRDFLADSQSSLPCLPSLVPENWPLSSKPHNHLIQISGADQRPSSTSSFTYSRFREKGNELQRPAPIKESSDIDLKPKSPTQHRRHSFLPRIFEAQNTPTLKNINSDSSSSLNIYGKSLSARARICKTTATNSSDRNSNAEPFVSWVVSKVEEQDAMKPTISLPPSRHVKMRDSHDLGIAKRPPRFSRI